MDENGSDGMCFWSENHALMFYSSCMIAGEMYPDDLFVRSNRLGKEQFEVGLTRCKEWLSYVENDGMEEFNSGNYMPATIAALLNVVDFAPEDVSHRAEQVLDRILRQFAKHIFDETIISPQGRIYRDVIYPTQQTAQSLLNMMFPEYPYGLKEVMWYSMFLTSKYHFPTDLREVAAQDYSMSYTSANARIYLEKTKDYILTSCQSPRAADDMPTWDNICFHENPYKGTNLYVKSLNERFHGTSFFKPGAYGYQQHLWYAALSNACVVFVSNPGSHVDCDEMRPGYWYGNMTLPAVQQQKNKLACVYCISDTVPTKFTHVFWPTSYFDEISIQEHWLFGRCKDGLVSVWCSGQLVRHDDVLTDCEYRCYDIDCAYVCACASVDAYGSLAAFELYCIANQPQWDAARKTVKTGELELGFVAQYDKTQVV